MLHWQFKQYNDLTVNEFHDIVALRIKVFVVEQNCPYQELDGKDKKSYHLICRDGHGDLAGTMRILPQSVSYEEVSFGRIVLNLEERGEHQGDQMMKEAMAFCKAEFGAVPIRLSGQKHLQSFYNKHGFYAVGKEYLEDGIPHLEMYYKPS
jgi:ElaA protein